MKADIQVESKVRVIDSASPFYRWRGVVKSETLVAEKVEGMPKPDVLLFTCSLHNGSSNSTVDAELRPDQVTCIQKKFIDIEQLREVDIDLGNDIVRHCNSCAFEVGDEIQISEKIDGANASIAWNAEDGCLEVFSRTNLLTDADGLRGFKAFIDVNVLPRLKDGDFATRHRDIVIFGEWLVPHSCKYDKDNYSKWYVYDIWDKTTKNYLKQSEVKKIAEELSLTYVHTLYEGPFISWDHCRSFLQRRTYGPQQEGIVVKNQTKLHDVSVRYPKVLKIVNQEFLESHVKRERMPTDPERIKIENEARMKTESVVTEARVKKFILKYIDECYVPAQVEPKHIGLLMKRLPKDIYNDILKEEHEVVEDIGPLAGKFCSAAVAKYVKLIILGK